MISEHGAESGCCQPLPCILASYKPISLFYVAPPLRSYQPASLSLLLSSSFQCPSLPFSSSVFVPSPSSAALPFALSPGFQRKRLAMLSFDMGPAAAASPSLRPLSAMQNGPKSLSLGLESSPASPLSWSWDSTSSASQPPSSSLLLDMRLGFESESSSPSPPPLSSRLVFLSPLASTSSPSSTSSFKWSRPSYFLIFSLSPAPTISRRLARLSPPFDASSLAFAFAVASSDRSGYTCEDPWL